jgi:hypothetical protein
VLLGNKIGSADRTLTDNILDTLNLAFLLERAFFTRLTTNFGALPRIRTETLRLLRPSSLPIGVGGQYTTGWIFTVLIKSQMYKICCYHPKLVAGEGFEPSGPSL